ncbi:MAG: 23S rRNA pseudouridine(2605) synthase RluB [Gammaproteobacteria bacterium]|nr:23S rRNA pseudouridine(2605) synthase RluB [Gammaproteobacteria bacterium]
MSAVPEGEKLQKVLAHAGLGSRRELERWIEEGRVSVDGKVVQLGARVLPNQTIRVDGHIVHLERKAPRRRILVYNKPEGEICTRSDPQGRPTVFESLPRLHNGRWVSVGRLDVNTGGLMLFTTDGELANRLMHPRYEIEREYAVRIHGEVSQQMLQVLRKGVELDDGLASFNSISDRGGEGSNHWYHVTLNEGKNREVRRLWESQGLQVSRLTRVRFGPINLSRQVRQGRWQDLDEAQIQVLYQLVGLRAEAAPRSKPARANKPGKRSSRR